MLADVTVDTTGAEGVLFKQGGAHGGHVLFIQDGRLHYVYNFLGERQQLVSSSGAVPLGSHLFGVATRGREPWPDSHTPLGDVTLFIDDAVVGTLAEVTQPPGHVRVGGRRHHRRPQRRFGGVQPLQGAVRVHRRHHRRRSPSTCPAGPIRTWKPNLRLPFRATELSRA